MDTSSAVCQGWQPTNAYQGLSPAYMRTTHDATSSHTAVAAFSNVLSCSAAVTLLMPKTDSWSAIADKVTEPSCVKMQCRND